MLCLLQLWRACQLPQLQCQTPACRQGATALARAVERTAKRVRAIGGLGEHVGVEANGLEQVSECLLAWKAQDSRMSDLRDHLADT